jgi:Leucine-rich repeat (LRR) protein
MLSNLKVISLENGKMSGSLPYSFYNLTKLRELSISGQSFIRQIQTEIGNLRDLTLFKISSNKFSGTLPSELGLCEKLSEWFAFVMISSHPPMLAQNLISLNITMHRTH